MDTAIDDSSLIGRAAPPAASRKLGIRSLCFYSRQPERFKAQRDMNQVCGVAETQFMDTQAHKWPLRPHVHTAIPFSAICLGDVTKKSLAGPTVEHMLGDNQLPLVMPAASQSFALIHVSPVLLVSIFCRHVSRVACGPSDLDSCLMSRAQCQNGKLFKCEYQNTQNLISM